MHTDRSSLMSRWYNTIELRKLMEQTEAKTSDDNDKYKYVTTEAN